MKRIYGILIGLMTAAAVGGSVSAQVAKQVEVTKDYIPQVAKAEKKSIEPNMVDTVTIRPDIDYTITPRSFSSALNTSRLRPASVTYWEYDRKYPFYLKAGVGYPLNTIADLYATTHRADVGYLTGYVNHQGQFSKIKVIDPSTQGIFNNNARQMLNRVGVNGGKYVGRYTLNGDVFYESDVYNRYPYETVNEYDPRKIDFENIALKLKFGDSFADLSHLNFMVDAGFDFYNDKSATVNFADLKAPTTADKYQQIAASASARIARNIGKRSMFSVAAGYRGYYGMRTLSHYRNTIASLAVRYGYKSKRMLDLKVGVDYHFDKVSLLAAKHHVMPYVYLGLNVRDNGRFVPYVELNGELHNNSYQELQRRNPYVAMLGYAGMPSMNSAESLPNTALYNLRFGFTGHTKNSRLAYRLYANMAFIDNSLYWYSVNRAFFGVELARRNICSINASVEYKPISSLIVEARVRGMIYTTFATVENALPAIEARLALRYTHRKFAIGASADLVGSSRWTSILKYRQGQDFQAMVAINPGVKVPTTVDVGLTADWFASDKCTVFIEGRNLANMNIYRWVYYREYGIHFTAGVKIQF